MVSEFIALSHARMQQSGPTALRAAVLDAQHAVALLLAESDSRVASQIRDALTTELNRGSLPPVHIGDTPYDDLLSPDAKERARLRSLAHFARPPTSVWNVVLSPTVAHGMTIASLTHVAAVYQQLGLALQAAGEGVEAQQAFAFADEIAAMRPAVGQQQHKAPAAR